MCGVVECAILSVDKKGKLKEIHTYGVATSGNAGSSHICLPEFQQSSPSPQCGLMPKAPQSSKSGVKPHPRVQPKQNYVSIVNSPAQLVALHGMRIHAL
jgi:hypothetical protein